MVLSLDVLNYIVIFRKSKIFVGDLKDVESERIVQAHSGWHQKAP